MLVDVEKIYSWGQGDHNHLALAAVPVAGRIMIIKMLTELMS